MAAPGLILPYQSQQSGILLADKSAAPYDPGSGKMLLYDHSGDLRVLRNGSLYYPVQRTWRNHLRNSVMTLWPFGTGAIAAPTTYDRFASYRAPGWYVLPTGATNTMQQGAPITADGVTTPGTLQINGTGASTGYKFAQRLTNIQTSAVSSTGLPYVFSGLIRNDSGVAMTPTIHFYTPAASNNFATLTSRASYSPGPIASGTTFRFALSATPGSFTNIGNGLEVAVVIPTANATAGSVRIGGCQLTEGTQPLPFLEMLPEDVELNRIHEYMQSSYGFGTPPGSNVGTTGLHHELCDTSSTNQVSGQRFITRFLVTPEVKIYAGDGTINRVSDVSGTPAGPTTVAASAISDWIFRIVVATAGAYTANTAYTYAYWASGELPG